MAVPAVIVKAKSALTKAKKANDIKNTVKNTKNALSDNSEDNDKKKILTIAGIGCFPLFIPIVSIFVVVLSIGSIFNINLMQAVDSAYANQGNYSNISAGQAASIEGESERIAWLYDGNGVPQTEEDNTKYLETFSVNYMDIDGNIQTQDLTMHEKLKTEVQSIFNELVAIKFPIEWSSGGGSIRGWNADTGYSGAFYRSAHCYGHAVDINVASNPCAMCGVGSESDYQPGVDPYSITPEVVAIFKKHGFYWGGDWTNPIDYMHFSYFDH